MKLIKLLSLALFFHQVINVSAQVPTGGNIHSTAAIKSDANSTRFVQIVKFKSTLPDSVVFDVIEKRKVAFLNVPGLLQKYYLRDVQTQEFCGVYLWATEQDYLNFRTTDLSKTSAQAYQVEGKARVELFEMIYPLR